MNESLQSSDTNTPTTPIPTQTQIMVNYGVLIQITLNILPVGIWDIGQWLGAPSVIVIDCGDARKIHNNFCDYQTAMMRQKQLYKMNNNNNNCGNNDDSLNEDKEEELTMKQYYLHHVMMVNFYEINPHYPTDILKFFSKKKKTSVLSDGKDEIINLFFDPSIGGTMKNEKTGELHWIFLSVTDTIAPTKLFLCLLRVDFVNVVPSLFRNFLLAQRIMKSMNRTPLSIPSILATTLTTTATIIQEQQFQHQKNSKDQNNSKSNEKKK